MNLNLAIKSIWPFLKPYRGRVFLAIFANIIEKILSVIEPFVLGLAITEVSRNVVDIVNGVPGAGINYHYIFWVLVFYFVRGFIVQISAFGANYFITSAVQPMAKDIRDTLMHKINRLPISYFDQRQFGDVLGRITSDVETVSNACQQVILQVTGAVFQIILVAVMMFLIHWQLAIVVLIAMPLSYLVARFLSIRSQPKFKQQADILGRMNGFVQENLTGFHIIKLYGQEEQAMNQFNEIIDDLYDTGFQASFIASVMTPLVGVVAHIAYLLVAVIGSLLAIAGQLTVGNLQAFTQYVWQVTEPIGMITQMAGVIQSATAAAARIMEVLNHPEEESTAVRHIPEPVEGHVQFDHVYFAYDQEVPLIQDFNLNVSPGEMIAIVGPTGAGKTTMINLLMRFYDVDRGAILVDGVDVRDVSRQDHRERFGMVLQDAWLFEGTVSENLRFGRLDATEEEIIAAAKAANADHFIRTLPGGYDSKINQETTNISQGQKQLLTIARALLSDPKILILDEATSSVDTRLEHMIQSAMDNLMQGRTSFVIAHRLSTIQNADRIIVMNKGQIIEQGNHDELLDQQGFYYNLYNSQFASQTEDI